MNLKELKQKLEDATIEVVHTDKRCSNITYTGYELLREILESNYEDEIKAFSKNIGLFERVTQESTENAAADHFTKHVFKIDGVLYALDTWYNSWDGGEFNPEELYEVEAVEKTITIYEPKDKNRI